MPPRPDEVSKQHESKGHLWFEFRQLTATESVTFAPSRTANDHGLLAIGDMERRKPSTLDTAMRALSTGGLSLIIKDYE